MWETEGKKTQQISHSCMYSAVKKYSWFLRFLHIVQNKYIFILDKDKYKMQLLNVRKTYPNLTGSM